MQFVHAGVDSILAVNNGINTYPGLNDVWDGGEEVLDDTLVQVPLTLDLAVL